MQVLKCRFLTYFLAIVFFKQSGFQQSIIMSYWSTHKKNFNKQKSVPIEKRNQSEKLYPPFSGNSGKTEKKVCRFDCKLSHKGYTSTHDWWKRVKQLIMLEKIVVYQHYIILVTNGYIHNSDFASHMNEFLLSINKQTKLNQLHVLSI